MRAATEVNTIIIDVENEIGEKTPVEIDDTDDQNEAGALTSCCFLKQSC